MSFLFKGPRKARCTPRIWTQHAQSWQNNPVAVVTWTLGGSFSVRKWYPVFLLSGITGSATLSQSAGILRVRSYSDVSYRTRSRGGPAALLTQSCAGSPHDPRYGAGDAAIGRRLTLPDNGPASGRDSLRHLRGRGHYEGGHGCISRLS